MRRPSAAASSAAGILPSTFSKPVRVSTRRVHRYHLPTAETPPTQTPTFFPKSGHDFIFSGMFHFFRSVISHLVLKLNQSILYMLFVLQMKCLAIGKTDFQRLLGSIDDVMRNAVIR